MVESSEARTDEKRSGRRPEGPAHPRKGGVVQTVKRTIAEFKEDNLTDSAAALTYYAVLSIFPALIALVSIVGLVGDPEDGHQLAHRRGDVDRAVIGGRDLQGADRGHHQLEGLVRDPADGRHRRCPVDGVRATSARSCAHRT